MQAATGTMLAAMQARERTLIQVVSVDWKRDGTWFFDPGIYDDVYTDVYPGAVNLGDLTPFVESVDVSRSLSTDLPEASKSTSGFAAAEATVVLAGSIAGVPMAQVFGAYNNALTTYAPRIGAPITIDLGFRGTSGVEVLRQFTGRVRGCSVDPATGSVTLTCIDRRESFRSPVVLPVVVRDNFDLVRPGLNAQWMLETVSRAQGFYTSPPLRPSCVLAVRYHGAAWPDVGTVTQIGRGFTGSTANGPARYQNNGSGLPSIILDDLAVLPAFSAKTFSAYTLSSVAPIASGSAVALQMWIQHSGGANTGKTFDLFEPTYQAEILITPFAGNIRVVVTRGASTFTNTIATAALTDGIEHFLGMHFTFNASTIDYKIQVDHTLYTGTLTGPWGAAVTTMTTLWIMNGDCGTVSLRDLQVTTEPYVTNMWDSAVDAVNFVPNAVFELSQNELTATPTVDTSDPWEICQQIAAAEQGIFGFDENGVLRFFNRDHMTGGSAVATITSAPSVSFANLKQAASDEQVDGIANYVTVGAVPLVVQGATDIWALSEVVGVIASSFLTLFVDFPGPVYALNSVVYKAAKAVDGTAGDITNLIVSWQRVSASTYSIRIGNPNAFDAFLVGNSTTPTQAGDPYLVAAGQCILPATESGYVSIRQDGPSQNAVGTQSLDVPANVWRQSTTVADALADDLLAALKDSHPVLGAVDVVSDIRLQLADRVRVADPTGLALDQDFWVTALAVRHSGSDTGQTVTLRQV